MRRLFILSSLAMMIALGIGGCGGGSEGTSADPLGTDGITFGHKNNVEGSDWSMALQVNPGGTAVLTAKVKNVSNIAVAGREVTFVFKSNTSGATINVSKANTDGEGEAVIIYRAGPNSGLDTVRASISNGREMETNITVGTAGMAGRTITLNGTPTALSAGQNSILTATVRDGDGNLVMGQFVSFSYISNPSGATLTTLSGGITDASGTAIAIYKAGSLTPTVDVQDIVEASIAGRASGVISITRTASTAVGYRVTLTPGTASLAAGQNTTLSALVTDPNSGKPINGQTVTFRFVGGAAPSGATLTTLNGGITDAAGQAIAVYTAGAILLASTLEDVVEATVSGASDVKIITRTASTAVRPTGNSLALSPKPTSPLAAGENTVITATVTNNATGFKVGGVPVIFTLLSNTSGATLVTLNGGVTDAEGKAVAVYTAGTNTPASSLQDVIQASVSGATDALVMTRTAVGGGAGGGVRMNVTAVPTSLNAGAFSVITATVTNASNDPVSGQTVTFAIAPNNSGATLTTVNATTDASGTAIATYTAGSASPTVAVQDVVTATVPGSAGAVIITRTASTAGTYAVSMSPPSPASVTAGQVSIITATVTSGSAPAGGVTVTFTLPVNQSGATLSAASATTDGSGKAVVIYQPGTTSPTLTVQDTVQAAVGTATDATVITRVGSAASAYGITVTAAPTTLATNVSNSVITANVTNSAGTAISGVTVNFAVTGVVPVGTLSVASATTDGSGNAVTTFTGNGVAATGATSVVTASITVSGNTYTNAVIITYP